MGGMIGALGGFLVVGALRVVLVQQSTFFINSLCHTIGNQPYSVRCSARDSWIMALVTYGEGYHNYHHEFQHDYRNGVKAWNFDPTKWAIMLLHKLGLVSNLRRVSESKIIGAEMREAQRKAEAKLAELHEKDGTICEHTMARVDELLTKLKNNLNELESSVSESLEASRSSIRQWQRETRELVRRLGDLRLVTA
jgi:stearoyl-CoA desaturase (delta-9 desaturase)